MFVPLCSGVSGFSCFLLLRRWCIGFVSLRGGVTGLSCFVVGAKRLLRRAADRQRQAYRPGTRANVRSHVLLYLAFARKFGFRDFPATLGALLAFAEFMLLSFTAPKSVLNALASLKHFHLDFQWSVEVFEARELVLWRRALPLTCRHLARPAPPLMLDLLQQLVGLALRLGPEGTVLAALMAFLFASMARLSSLVAGTAADYDRSRLPTLADVQLTDGVLSLRLKWAKAHQAADDGYWVPLGPRPGSVACPVERWQDLRRLSAAVPNTDPLFWCPGLKGIGGRTRQHLTMPVAREWLARLLRRLGRAGEGYTFHSFRRGACTSAFLQGAAEEDIRALGGWNSDAVRSYLPVDELRRRAARALTTVSSPP